jgi:hypothetical protein
MKDAEATQVTMVIGELWPKPPMSEVRATFYAAALSSIPTIEIAMKAVNKLFLRERFQPTAGDVIDICLALEPLAIGAWEQIVTSAALVASREPLGDNHPTPEALTALRSSGRTLGDLPVNDSWAMERIRTKFLDTYRETQRDKLIDNPQKELTATETTFTVPNLSTTIRSI